MKFFARNSRIFSVVAACLAIALFSINVKAGSAGDDVPLNAGDVLIGPCGVPGAMGTTGVNDDFTNRSVKTGIASVAPGGVTTGDQRERQCGS
jgi:hypothetical protein